VAEPTARAAWPIPDGFGMQCQCGTCMEVHVTIDGIEKLAGQSQLADFAVTCDTCGATHWIQPVVGSDETEGPS